ncbi:phospholipase A(1) DAD1, chloroplastic-like [Chenopodium quinoa]|uniref:phospholipase A(1) DAD1, chloroplastic-like n=1 Tax=Chenopodium quinoa TaxID=63459 RepID=UPI000B799458|nr:phospholipase A(1) DAD1, chloroplastic-like [Chenopodium quinoa]
MRLSMKSFALTYDIPSSGISPHVPTQQHCNLTKQTQQLMMTFQSSQQSLLHHSIKPTTATTTTTTTTSKSGRGVRHMGSPRVADRWKEYMGARDWEGLLDPLDENLRDEILRYGSFIEATYRGFDFDPGSPSFGSSKYKKKSFFRDCGLPTPGFRLTRHLRATSGIQVPEWAQSNWSPVKTSWIGYVAVCNDKAMIDHLGRREVVIALRGTATCLEWLENLRATLAPVPGSTSINNDNMDPRDLDGPPMVESGFLSLYTSGTDMWPSLQDSIRMEVSRILELYQDKQPLSITITGHSLGAALATLAAYDIKTTFDRAPLLTVISFGGPRVGNQSFRSLVDKQGTKILRVVNPSDLITKVPGFVTDNTEEFVNINNKSTSPTKKFEEKNSKNPCNNNNTNNKSNHRSNRPGKIESNISSHFCKIKSSCGGSHFGFGEVESRSPSNNSGSKKLNQLAELCLNWIQQFRVEDTQWWVYAEVGRELRLASSESEQLSYYLGNMDVAKCHDLKTYLNLVEDCPLKNLFRRSLNKLSESCSVHKKESNGVFALLCKQF